jgi:glycosyltransferase involved in cell wall biosynthesis
MPVQVSVVIPTRNRAALLRRALGTVLAQRFTELEIIVVDDASTDDTAAVLETVGDARVRALRHPERRGVAAARNAGIAAAAGRWVAFLDDDDLWAPNKLARQVDALVGQPGARWVVDGAVVVDGRLQVIGAQPPPTDGDLAAALLAANVVPGGASGVVAERGLVVDAGGFDPALGLLADWDLWTRLALRAAAATVRAPLHAYHLHGGSMSAQDRTGEAELRIVEAKYAREREERGVVLATEAFAFWLADRRQRGHRRLAAAGSFLRSAGYAGTVSACLHAAAALVWPDSIRHMNARRGTRVDPHWVAQAEGWLAPLRSPAPS